METVKKAGLRKEACRMSQEGLEPPTYRFEVCHSVQLSYWPERCSDFSIPGNRRAVNSAAFGGVPNSEDQ